jgi:pentatricopeptide repeat protein
MQSQPHSISPDVTTWNTLMSAYSAAGTAAKCEELIKTMQAPPHCVEPDVTTWNTLMSAYSAAGNTAKCEELVATIQAQPQSISPDVATWNTLMSAYSAAGNTAKCEELLKIMQAPPHCIAPNVTTWTTLMNAYACGGNAAKCEELLKIMQAPPHCIALNVTTWTTLMNAYACGGNAAKCEELLKIMQAQPHCIAPNVTTWTTLMNAYACGGNAAKCEELLKIMQAPPHCIAPNVTTWNTLMKAYSAAGNAAKCEELIKQMQTPPHFIAPNIATWNSLLSSYTQISNFVRSVNIYELLEQILLRQEVVHWGVVDMDFFLAHSGSEQWNRLGLPPVPKELLDVHATGPSLFEQRSAACKKVVDFVRAVHSFGYTQVSRLRIMMVGLGEVGKTRLVRALQSGTFTSEEISKEERTIAADISEFKLISPKYSDQLTACIWDFAGQEVYYMSHSLFMSPRAVYVLVWKRPDADSANALEPAKAGLRRWLEMIGLHVPDAKVLIVGTHCATPGHEQTLQSYTEQFGKYSDEIKGHVKTVIDELNWTIRNEDKAIEGDILFQAQSDSLLRRRALLRGIRKTPITAEDIAAKEVSQMSVGDESFRSVDSATGMGVRDLYVFLDELGRKLTEGTVVPKSYSLIERCMSELRGSAAFGDILSKNDAIEQFVRIFQEDVMQSLSPKTSIDVKVPAKSRKSKPQILVSPHQGSSDDVEPQNASVSSVAVSNSAISSKVPAKSRKSKPQILVSPHQGSSDDVVPQNASVSSVAVSNSAMSSARHEVAPVASGDVGEDDITMGTEQVQVSPHQGSRSSANEHDEVRLMQPVVEVGAPPGLREDDCRIANSMSPENIWQGFLFWHDMGSMFVSTSADGENDFVVPDPKVLLDFIKPLVHADPLKMLCSERDKALLSIGAQQKLKTINESFEEFLTVMLCNLRDNSSIAVTDLQYFRTWSEIYSNTGIRTTLLHLFRDNLIVDIDAKDPACLEAAFTEDSKLTVSARIHVAPGEFQPVHSKFYLVYLLPIHNVSLLVLLKKALEARTRALVFKVSCSYSSTDSVSFIDIKRAEPLAVWSQIAIQQARDKLLENTFNFKSLEDILQRRVSSILSLTCNDSVFLSIVARSVSDALSVAYPHARIKCFISSKHIRHPVSLPPWIRLSELLRYGMQQVVDMVDIIDGQVADDIAITGFMSQKTMLKCAQVFPSDPSICVYSEPAVSAADRHGCFTEQLKRHLIKSLGVEVCHILTEGNFKFASSARVFIICMAPQFLANSDCLSFLNRAIDACQPGSGRKLYILPTHPCTTLCGLKTIIHNEGCFYLDSQRGLTLRQLCPESLKVLAKVMNFMDNNLSICDIGLSEDARPRSRQELLFRLSDTILFNFNETLLPMPCIANDPVFRSRRMADDKLFHNTYSCSIKLLQCPQFSHLVLDIVRHLNSFGLTDDHICDYFTDQASSEINTTCDVAISQLQSRGLQIDASRLKLAALSSFSQAETAFASDTISISSSLSSTSTSSHFSISSGCDCILTLRHSVPIDCLRSEDIKVIKHCLGSACNDLGCNFTSIADINTEAHSPNECDITLHISGTFCDTINAKYSELSQLISSYSSARTTLVLSRNRFLAQTAQLKDVLARERIKILPPFHKVRKGGYGTIYKCKYHDLSTPRALKLVQVPKIDFCKQGVIFRDEGILLDLCSKCEHVVTFHDSFVLHQFGSSETITKVFIMDWMEHGDLSNLLAEVSKSRETSRLYITPQLFMTFSFQILEALHFLHSKKPGLSNEPGKNTILHRDIKPENILVKCDSLELDLSKVSLKLSDFGLSKELTPDESSNSMGAIAGTPAYKSPQCFEHKSCPADDTWSAALVLVELLCGFPVWLKGKNILDWSAPIGPRGLSHVSKVNADKVLQNCHPWLRVFAEPVMSALRPEPQLRCSDPKQLLLSLQKCNEHKEFIHDVFISHHLQDVEFAQQLEDELSDAGLKVYRASIGCDIYTWCIELLRKTADFAIPYLEDVLKCVHLKVIDDLHLSEDDKRLLESTTKYDDSDSPLAVVHRRIVESVSKYTAYSGKSDNADMTKIALEEGWFEVGKLCSSSMGGHESAKGKKSISDCDVEFVFNLLKNIKDVPERVRTTAGTCYRLRNSIIGHYQLKLRGECDAQKFSDVSDAALKVLESLREHSEHSGNLANLELFDKHIAWIHSFNREKESRILSHMVKSVSVLLQSRFVVPIVSDSAEQWLMKGSGRCCNHEVLLYCSIAFAAMQVSQSCKMFFSRVREVLPVHCFTKLDLPAKFSKCTDTCLVHKGLFSSDLPLFCANFSKNAFGMLSDIDFETESETFFVQSVANNAVRCCQEHMLFPGLSVCFVGNDQHRDPLFEPKYNAVYFISEESFSPTVFKISLTQDGPPLDLHPFVSATRFKPASNQFFQHLISRTVSEIWARLQTCAVTVCETNTAEAATKAASEFSLRISSTSHQHISQKLCRFKIIQRFKTISESSNSTGSSLFVSPSEDIIRVKVQKDTAIPDSEDPREGMLLHSRDDSSNIGVVLWVKSLRTQDDPEKVEFILDIFAKSDPSCVKEEIVCCSCSPSFEVDSDFQVYKRVLRGYGQELGQLVQEIVKASTSEDIASQEIVASLFARIETLKIEQYRLHVRFQGMSDEAILRWHDLQRPVFNCQVSIQRSLLYIQKLTDSIESKVSNLRLKELQVALTECCRVFEQSFHEIDAIILSKDGRVSAGWQYPLQHFLDTICIEVSSRCKVSDLSMRIKTFEGRHNQSHQLINLIRQYRVLSNAKNYDPDENGKIQLLKRQRCLFDAITCKFDDEKANFMQIQLKDPSVELLMEYHIRKEAILLELIRAHSFHEGLANIIKDFNANHWTEASIPDWILDIRQLVTWDKKTRFLLEGPVNRDAIDAVSAEIKSNNDAIKFCQKIKEDLLKKFNEESPGGDPKSVTKGHPYLNAEKQLDCLNKIKDVLKLKLTEVENVVIKKSHAWIKAIQAFNAKMAATSPADQESSLQPDPSCELALCTIVDAAANDPVKQQSIPFHLMSSLDVANVIGRIGAAYAHYESEFVSNGVDGTMLQLFASEAATEVLQWLSEGLHVHKVLHRLRIFAELKKLWEPLAPIPLVEVNAAIVAETVGNIADLYKPYQQVFIDNGFDGAMLFALAGVSDTEVLKLFEIDLGITDRFHRPRILSALKPIMFRGQHSA